MPSGAFGDVPSRPSGYERRRRAGQKARDEEGGFEEHWKFDREMEGQEVEEVVKERRET